MALVYNFKFTVHQREHAHTEVRPSIEKFWTWKPEFESSELCRDWSVLFTKLTRSILLLIISINSAAVRHVIKHRPSRFFPGNSFLSRFTSAIRVQNIHIASNQKEDSVPRTNPGIPQNLKKKKKKISFWSIYLVYNGHKFNVKWGGGSKATHAGSGDSKGKSTAKTWWKFWYWWKCN